MRLGISPADRSTPTGVFNQRFEALFPGAGALGCAVCFTTPLFLPVKLCVSVGLRGLLEIALPAPFVPQSATSLGLATLPRVCPPQLPVSAPPTGLDECFFISLVVGFPCGSIFCQFWLFFVFKLLSFFWLCEEAQCVHLRLHLVQNSVIFLSLFSYSCLYFLPTAHTDPSQVPLLPLFLPSPLFFSMCPL